MSYPSLYEQYKQSFHKYGYGSIIYNSAYRWTQNNIQECTKDIIYPNFTHKIRWNKWDNMRISSLIEGNLLYGFRIEINNVTAEYKYRPDAQNRRYMCSDREERIIYLNKPIKLIKLLTDIVPMKYLPYPIYLNTPSVPLIITGYDQFPNLIYNNKDKWLCHIPSIKGIRADTPLEGTHAPYPQLIYAHGIAIFKRKIQPFVTCRIIYDMGIPKKLIVSLIDEHNIIVIYFNQHGYPTKYYLNTNDFMINEEHRQIYSEFQSGDTVFSNATIFYQARGHNNFLMLHGDVAFWFTNSKPSWNDNYLMVSSEILTNEGSINYNSGRLWKDRYLPFIGEHKVISHKEDNHQVMSFKYIFANHIPSPILYNPSYVRYLSRLDDERSSRVLYRIGEGTHINSKSKPYSIIQIIFEYATEHFFQDPKRYWAEYDQMTYLVDNRFKGINYTVYSLFDMFSQIIPLPREMILTILRYWLYGNYREYLISISENSSLYTKDIQKFV